MNFISLEHVGSLYPMEPLQNRFSYAYRVPPSLTQKAVLSQWGFVLTELNGHLAGHHVCPDIHCQLAGFAGTGLFEFLRTGVSPEDFQTGLVLGWKEM